MMIRISRVDDTLPLPEYQTPGAVGFDMYARVETLIAPHQVAIIPSNLIIAVPDGYVLLVASRSGTPRKKGLSMPHGMGIIDQDYCGPDDEIGVQLYNFTDAPVTVARGERIAQGMIVPVVRATWKESAQDGGSSRGGFGSTG